MGGGGMREAPWPLWVAGGQLNDWMESWHLTVAVDTGTQVSLGPWCGTHWVFHQVFLANIWSVLLSDVCPLSNVHCPVSQSNLSFIVL